MTRLRRAQVRAIMWLRHRPIWLTFYVAAQMAAWGGYVLSMHAPLSRTPSFGALNHLPDANCRVGAMALAAGLLLMVATVTDYIIARVIADILAMYVACALANISIGGSAEHPAVVLYSAPVLAIAFDLAGLAYDLLSRRR